MINNLSDHYVICGYGRIGSIVASRVQAAEDAVRHRRSQSGAACAEANQRGHLAVEGDASREDTLKQLGIDRARGLVAAVGTDAENVYAVLTARVMKADLFIIARAEGEESISKLKKAGADRVISPYRIGARADCPDGAAARPSSTSSKSRRARTIWSCRSRKFASRRTRRSPDARCPR